MANKYEKSSINVFEIIEFCKEHNKQFEIYCKKHDRPCCSKCVVSDHQTCQDLILVEDMVKNAQFVIPPVQSNSIDNISVILQDTIDTKLDNITGGVLLPDGIMVFSCYSTNRVRGFKRKGSQDQAFDIILKPNAAFDITYIHDNNTIAVTGGGRDHYISIIDIESRKVMKTFPVGSWNYGIVSRNNTLIYCAKDRGIQMINMSDKSVSNIVTREMSPFAYVTTFADKLYYTNEETHTVTCCDLSGTIQWEFKDESVLSYPQSISVDNAGNVYVVGGASANVVVISPDGQRHKQLLSGRDGLNRPQVLHYDRSTNQLLVANRKGMAFLYKLE